MPPGALVLGLGANLGDRGGALRRALAELEARLGQLEIASPYRSALVPTVPTGAPAAAHQLDYLNTVAIARLEGPVEGRRLLGLFKALEKRAGRIQGGIDRPRPLDIDILLAGELELDLPSLDAQSTSARGSEWANPAPPPEGGDPMRPFQPLEGQSLDPWPGALRIPHPRLHERLFVLLPLAEIAPHLPIPTHGRSARELLEELERGGCRQEVEKIGWNDPV